MKTSYGSLRGLRWLWSLRRLFPSLALVAVPGEDGLFCTEIVPKAQVRPLGQPGPFYKSGFTIIWETCARGGPGGGLAACMMPLTSTGQRFFEAYWQAGFQRTLDVGARNINGSLRDFCPPDAEYIGVDLEDGHGVDIVLQHPASFPFPDETFDLAVSMSCFEHDGMFWVTSGQLARVRSGGYIYINAPSNGPSGQTATCGIFPKTPIYGAFVSGRRRACRVANCGGRKMLEDLFSYRARGAALKRRQSKILSFLSLRQLALLSGCRSGTGSLDRASRFQLTLLELRLE